MKLWKVGVEEYDNGDFKVALLGCRDYKGSGPKNTVKKCPGMTAYNNWYKTQDEAFAAIKQYKEMKK